MKPGLRIVQVRSIHPRSGLWRVQPLEHPTAPSSAARSASKVGPCLRCGLRKSPTSYLDSMKLNRDRMVAGVLALGASIVASASARSYADSANDGSRLATVQSLVDHGTLAIDDSIFVRPPPTDSPRPLPYALRDNGLPELGTCDKVRIKGRFYSHQPPVPAVLMAAAYGVLKWSCGLDARARTDWFCYLMTLSSCGLAYVASVFLAYRMGPHPAAFHRLDAALAAVLGLATVAPAYTRHVNGHILLLPIALCIFERLAACFEDGVVADAKSPSVDRQPGRVGVRGGASGRAVSANGNAGCDCSELAVPPLRPAGVDRRSAVGRAASCAGFRRRRHVAADGLGAGVFQLPRIGFR